MKVKFLPIAAFFIASLCACSSDDNHVANTVIPIEVNFSTFDIAVIPDGVEDEPNEQSAVTRATATESGVTRIAFKVYDAHGKEAYAEEKKFESDDDFDHVRLSLRNGSYTFVAVAHKARTDESPVASIASPTVVRLNELFIPSTVYSTTHSVTVSDNSAQSVTMNFGKRVTSSFKLKVTDAYPDDVETVEMTLNPSKTAADQPYAFSPATGLADKEMAYTAVYNRTERGVTSFTGKTLTVSAFLTSTEQQMDVLINMKNTDDKVIYTRTLHNVTLRQHATTKAVGTFFSSSVTGGFTFDTTDEATIEIPLD